MECFHCSHCGMMVFFENSQCLKCSHPLGFLPDTLVLSALDKNDGGLLRAVGAASTGKTYRNCSNGTQHAACNWLVPSDDANDRCVACRLNEIIPDLTDKQNLARWSKLELAKRRCIYTFLRLGLPMQNGNDGKTPGLRFNFLQESAGVPVKTGHENGLVTVNIAEADDDERERRRLNFHEPYRTLVGHFRHESGHYYWDRLIANSPNLAEFRKLFGDENVSYDTALQTYYRQGPAPDWATKTVTPYACSHPWEDWAETWAHYLHILDTLETAASFGLGVSKDSEDRAEFLPISYAENMDFDNLLAEWTPLTCALNAVNRGMGLSDLYPFVISPPVVEKLRFIHKVIFDSKRY